MMIMLDRFLNGYRHYIVHQYQQARVEGAFVAIEPDTGNVKVLVGGSQFNYTNQLK
jgi:membrane carboxypeptidase/penicillin-binding protein